MEEDEAKAYRGLTRIVVGFLSIIAALLLLLGLPHYIAHIDDVRARAALLREMGR